jgi:lipopolysaccharide biosynthesis regulator YciM
MDEKKIEEFKEDFALLIEAGFVAVKQLDEISATRIFHAAHAISPDHTAPVIGLGYIALNKLEIKEATKTFQAVLQTEPDNYLAKTFLGMCYLLTKSKREEGEKLIADVMKKTDDESIINLCNISLEWADKDLKKLKSPFLGDASEKKTKVKKT